MEKKKTIKKPRQIGASEFVYKQFLKQVSQDIINKIKR